MKTKYDIHEMVLIPATVNSVRITGSGTVLYDLKIASGDIKFSDVSMVVAEKQIRSANIIKDEED